MVIFLASVALAQTVEPVTVELLEATDWLMVRTEPRADAERRGRIAPGYSVAATARVSGPGCEDDWVELVGDGFACSTWLAPTERLPERVPRLVPFDHPEPGEYEAYRDGEGYDRSPLDEADPLLPFIYGKRWRSWQGRIWASAEHYGHGDDPIGNLARSSKHAFVAAVDTPAGQVLLQDDGTVVPADEVFLYPVDRFGGRQLADDPVHDGQLVAWAHRYAGARVRLEPSASSEVALTIDYHEQLAVDAAPASEDGHWWRVPDALGAGVDGFVDDRTDIRHWVPSPPVEGLAADAVWLDVDAGQQVAALRKGDALLYVTVVSSGTAGRHATPLGIYELDDKTAWGDMASRAGADEVYHVENVPWVAHFWPRYALHGAFWHWGFGNRASHGCVNLAPRDAAVLLEGLAPIQPLGWHSVYATEEHPGGVIRIRDGQGAVPDKR